MFLYLFQAVLWKCKVQSEFLSFIFKNWAWAASLIHWFLIPFIVLSHAKNFSISYFSESLSFAVVHLFSLEPHSSTWVPLTQLISFLVLPASSAVKYDASKEERYQQEAKHKELQRIEEVLQMAASRSESSSPASLLCTSVFLLFCLPSAYGWMTLSKGRAFPDLPFRLTAAPHKSPSFSISTITFISDHKLWAKLIG